MNEELHQKLKMLVEDLRQEYPDAVVNLQSYTINNNAIVDVDYMGKEFVLEAAPNEGFGVTRMTPYNGFTLGSDAWFQTLPEAKEYLIQQFL